MNKYRHNVSAYKPVRIPKKRLTQTDLHKKAVSLLQIRAYRLNNGLIRFSEARRVICSCFTLNKQDFNVLIYELEQAGLLTIVPYNGLIVTVKGGRSAYSKEIEV